MIYFKNFSTVKTLIFNFFIAATTVAVISASSCSDSENSLSLKDQLVSKIWEHRTNIHTDLNCDGTLRETDTTDILNVPPTIYQYRKKVFQTDNTGFDIRQDGTKKFFTWYLDNDLLTYENESGDTIGLFTIEISNQNELIINDADYNNCQSIDDHIGWNTKNSNIYISI